MSKTREVIIYRDERWPDYYLSIEPTHWKWDENTRLDVVRIPESLYQRWQEACAGYNAVQDELHAAYEEKNEKKRGSS